VKVESGYTPGGVEGAVYRYKGNLAQVNLSTENYADTSKWELVPHRSSLEATTNSGGVQITELYGNLAVDEISTANGSDVKLVSQGGITVGLTSTGARYEGLIQGGAITIDAGGVVGTAGSPIILDSGNLIRDEVAIKAAGGVYIEEKTGNLRLQEIDAGGDVYVKVNSGSIIDARQE
jgi:flagellar basal body rod protein FlgF